MGVTQPGASDMMRGDITNLSERKLMDCLKRRATASRSECGHYRLKLVI